MAEGDTIHRIADRMRVALAGKTIERAEAPSPRSPLHTRASELRGRTLDDVEARGKHLIAHFSGDVAVHNPLGMNGRWFIRADGRLPYGKPWLVLASGRAVASLVGGKTLRLVSESRLRNDPGLAQLGPDPLAPDFDREDAAGRLLRAGSPTTGGGGVLRPRGRGPSPPEPRRRGRQRDPDRGLLSGSYQPLAPHRRARARRGGAPDRR